jgi:HAMP domain-containing protein
MRPAHRITTSQSTGTGPLLQVLTYLHGQVLEHALFQSLLKQWTGTEPARHKFDAGGLATNTPADGSETSSSAASAASGPSGPQHSLEDLVQSVSARRVSLQPAGDGTSQE